jgi:hypothetical protein
MCLSSTAYYDQGYEYFASATVIGKIIKSTESTKKMALKILPKYLKSKLLINRCHAAEALAFYRWPSAFEYLIECKTKADIYQSPTIYAILGDKRAVPVIIEEYRKLDKEYRSKPIHSYRQKMILLNVLYHLASPDSLSFVEEVIANPRPKEIKPRALKVKKRIIYIDKKSKAEQSSGIGSADPPPEL